MPAFFFFKQHDVAEAGAGRESGNQCAEADGAADKQLGEQNAHGATGDQPEDGTQERLEDAVGQKKGREHLFANDVHDQVQNKEHGKQEKRSF